MQKQLNVKESFTVEWVPLYRSLFLMLRKKQLFGWSILLVLITGLLTWAGFLLTMHLMEDATQQFFSIAPATDSILGWIKYGFWVAGDWLFSIVSHILAFYLAFLIAYSLTTPGYAFLSVAAEKLHAGEYFDGDADFNFSGFLIDIGEGIKIALFGVIVTFIAFFVNFIPGIGQATVILLYIYYSTLMFIDYPASRRRWSLGEKLLWLRHNSSTAFRLGVLPALLSMIPIVNIFAIALIFPLLTIHATLNFSAIELAHKPLSTVPGDRHGN